ncbi:biotin/lipoyl-containing protein [Peribacillus sp. ACCC06369]|uniref:biotin/lipoyl-containing protein n=1 Tax=Peribacillus sp. ACCC06369 TaxID=3055860 RepID=UPI0025A1095C|nr:biotin/lipoyl-containing protein [Peribacillus sp. ACCC06369]MDM5356803.1 biotin/lipoyl-containing protein [Peribacillus sp. ACCC06369]
MTSIIIPEIEEGIEKILLMQWYKQPGDYITVGESLAKFSCEGIEFDLFSEKEGTLKELHVAEDTIVKIGDLICYLDSGEALSGELLKEVEKQETIEDKEPLENVTSLAEKNNIDSSIYLMNKNEEQVLFSPDSQTVPVSAISMTYKEVRSLISHLYQSAEETFLKEEASFFQEIKKMLRSRWVYMNNGNVIYDHNIAALFPYRKYYELVDEDFDYKKHLDVSGYIGDAMTREEAAKSFNTTDHPVYKKIIALDDYSTSKNPSISRIFANQTANSSKSIAFKFNGYDIQSFDVVNQKTNLLGKGFFVPVFRLNGENAFEINDQMALHLWLENRLVPSGLSAERQKEYDYLLALYQLKGSDHESFLKELPSIAIDSKTFYEKLLNSEKVRADIDTYDEKMLMDPNRGHWDLWPVHSDEKLLTIKLNEEIMARNPKMDIREDGIVGIDFGTKSTVVVHQEESDFTLPMRIGVGYLNTEVQDWHYENPTVIEFIDLEHFLELYQEKEGRPDTRWQDVTVSHNALNNLMNGKSDHYYSILNNLKQWAGEKKNELRLKDKRGYAVVLRSFLDLTDQEINPIELYAYYLGLYINNQNNGIYLDYTLSFPVTYEKEVREKILKCFERGLKKTLPMPIQQDEELMKKFRVTAGASEPAAYAVCALQEYGFEPEEDEKTYYGVFDFGGGTTDFDFGIWREAGLRESRYDYVIEHFAAGGDRYLGGENLLELLAFQVFKNNQRTMRELNIPFTLPAECVKFPGSEMLINESQESYLNTKQLVEKLRPLWERHERYEEQFGKGMIRADLFDKAGHAKLNVELLIDQDEMEQLIEERIEKGIKNFFESLRRAFTGSEPSKISKVNILLAGNSSKSPIVMNLFNKWIEREVQNTQNWGEMSDNLFEIFPPLGTEGAYLKQEERNRVVNRDILTAPTGKTGVAFGLVQSRKGGSIKVIDRDLVNGESKFKYFLGIGRKGKLKTVIDQEEDYNIWHLFIDASEEDFEIYYTSLPEASTNQLDIKQAQRKKLRIEHVDDSAFVYIRTLSPTVIEYVVADEDSILNGVYLSETTKVELS